MWLQRKFCDLLYIYYINAEEGVCGGSCFPTPKCIFRAENCGRDSLDPTSWERQDVARPDRKELRKGSVFSAVL